MLTTDLYLKCSYDNFKSQFAIPRALNSITPPRVVSPSVESSPIKETQYLAEKRQKPLVKSELRKKWPLSEVFPVTMLQSDFQNKRTFGGTLSISLVKMNDTSFSNRRKTHPYVSTSDEHA